MGELGIRFLERLRLKIPLRGQDQGGRGGDQDKIVAGPRPPGGHQTSIRHACRRLRIAAQPSKVAVKIRPAWMLLLSRPARGRAASRRRLACGAGDEEASKTSAAVVLAASIGSGLSGLALTATRRRLASEGKCRGGRRSPLAAIAAQIIDIASNNAPTAPNA